MSNIGAVYIVDDEQSVRESLVYMLESFGFKPQQFASAKTFLTAIDISQPACVILDSRMPEMRGQELHALLNSQNSPLAVIFLTGHGDVPMAVDAFKEGAVDFFQKPVEGEALVVAIEKGLIYSSRKYGQLALVNQYKKLTEREKKVIKLLVKGLKNQQMAELLCVSLRTIEVHRANIMKKLGAANIADLVLRYGAVIVD